MVMAAAIWVYNDLEDRRAAAYSLGTAQVLLDVIGEAEASFYEDYDAPDAATTGRRRIVIDGETYIGVLRIPKLDLSLPINDTLSDEALKMTPCRYSGNIDDKDLVIAAHNYRTHFGRVHTLSEGDTLIFTDVEGRMFTFYVDHLVTVQPSEAAIVKHSEFPLTLFTCNYDGRARVVIRCIE